jgi:hypothetical protein
MKTNRRSVGLSSLALSSLVAVTVALSGLPAYAVEYQQGCYPLLSKACEVKEPVDVAPSPKPNPSPTVKPTTPADEDALKLLVKNLNSEANTKPIKVSDDATIGGKSNTVAEQAKVDTSQKSATVSASAGKPVSVAASGFQKSSPRILDKTYVEVVVWVSGKQGLIDLGNFPPSQEGVINTPPVTLTPGSRATFVFREMITRSNYDVAANTENPTRFNFRGKYYKFADYGAKYPETILFLRSSVAISAS